VTWADGTAPEWSTGLDDYVVFLSFDSGATWVGRRVATAVYA
jgi:hypothetical protein